MVNVEKSVTPVRYEPHLPATKLPILVLFQGWHSFFPDQVATHRRALATALYRQLTETILPTMLPTRRWFAGKGERLESIEIRQHAIWKMASSEWLLARVQVNLPNGISQTYSLPLALAWEE